MNCNEFEQRLADAWGDELADSDRARFEAHARDCPSCRELYEDGRRALGVMRSLDGPPRVVVRREANRLVLEWPGGVAGTNAAIEASEPQGDTSRPSLKLPWFLRGAIRHAAVLLIAFTAGYLFHAGLILFDARREAATSRPPDHVADTGTGHKAPRSATLHTALANAYTRSPGSSELATVLIALARADD
jgi:hypothetical protein